MTPFDLILHFLLGLTTDRLRAVRGSLNSEIGSRNPLMAPFDLILHFFVSVQNLNFLASTAREILDFSQSMWVTWPQHYPF